MPADAKTDPGGRDRIAWVAGVGAERGAGAAIARRFAQAGLIVALTGRSPDGLSLVAEQVRQAGGRAIVAEGDLQSPEQITKLAAELEKTAPIEAAIYNAGGAFVKASLDTTDAEFEAVWRGGCLGGFVFGREAARAMVARGRGTIIYTGATSSLRGRDKFAAFAAAKAGLRAVSQSFAREFGPKGVHVAHVVIDGQIYGTRVLRLAPQLAEAKGEAGMLNLEAIADAYWYVHAQDRSAWSQEIDLRPFSESF